MLGGLWGTQMSGSRKIWGEVWKNIWTNIIADPLSKSNRGLTRHCWLATCGGRFQKGCFNTTASFAQSILTAPKAFHHKDQTQLEILLVLNQTENKKTLNAQHSAEENRAGSFASFSKLNLWFTFYGFCSSLNIKTFHTMTLNTPVETF